ncbi:MAG: glycosyltransferase family 87 protein [Marinosulfonomonas sp.]
MATELGFQDKTVTPYVYPPLWAAVLSPMASQIGPMQFFNIALLVQAILLAASIILAYRIVKPPRMSLGIWYLLSFAIVILTSPFLLASWLNQPQLTLVFLVLLAFERYRAGASVTARIVLAFAASIKITPVLLGLIFLMDRDWKAATSACITGVLLLMTSLALAGPELHLAFVEQLGRANKNLIITPLNHSFEALAYQWIDIIDRRLTPPQEYEEFVIVSTTEWVRWVSRIAMISAIALLLYRSKNMRASDALYGRLLGIICATTFFLPLAWTHYLMVPMLLLPGLYTFMPFARASLSVLVLGGVLSTPFRSYFPIVDYDQVWTMSAGALLLIALYALSLVSFSKKPE